MRICHVTGVSPHGGDEVVARTYARELARRHEAFLLHCGPRYDRRRQPHDDSGPTENGYRVQVLPNHVHPRPWNSWINWKVFRGLGASLRRLRPDVVHFHTLQMRSLSVLSLLVSRQYRTFWTLHDLWSRCVWSFPAASRCGGPTRLCLGCKRLRGLATAQAVFKESVYRLSDLQVIVPAAWQIEQLRGSGLARFPIHHVPNGIDADLFRPGRDRPAADEDPIVLFCGGTAGGNKGFDDLVAASGRIAARQPSVRFRCLGDAPAGCAPSGRFEFTGWIDRARIHEQYRDAALVVMPSYADILPLTAMESLACETPVVAYRTSGIPEIIRHGETGLLVDQGDVGGLAAAVTELLDEPVRRREMGRGGRKDVLRRFSVERMVQQTEALYERALAPEKGG